MAGGIANMELLTPAEHDRIDALGDRLRDGINALGADLGLTVSATGVGSLLNIHLRDCRSARTATSSRARKRAAAAHRAAQRGPLPGPPRAHVDVDADG